MVGQGSGFFVQLKSLLSDFSHSVTMCWMLSTTHRKDPCSLAAAPSCILISQQKAAGAERLVSNPFRPIRKRSAVGEV